MAKMYSWTAGPVNTTVSCKNHMDALIQIIKTEWTKKSRGNPGAKLRNSVSNHFPISMPSFSGTSLQQVNYFESNEFKEPHLKEAKEMNSNQLREIRLELNEESNALEVKFWGTPIRPSYGTSKSIAKLPKNTWLQIIGNARVPYEDTTGYNKYVYNIFFGESEKANEIVNHFKTSKGL